MLDLIVLLAAALHQPVATGRPEVPSVTASGPRDEAAPETEIEVRGRRLCKWEITNSAESRLGRTRICLTSRQWTQRRDEAVELYDELPRRNPRSGPSATASFSPN